MRKAHPRKDLVKAWRDLDDNAKDLANARSKEAARRLRVTGAAFRFAERKLCVFARASRQQAVAPEDQEFLHQVGGRIQKKIPLPKMTELAYHSARAENIRKIAKRVFMLLAGTVNCVPGRRR